MAMTRRDSGNLLPRLFEHADLFDWTHHPLALWGDAEQDQFKVEEFMDGDNLVVRAEIPGVDPDEDIDVSIVDGNLHIRAERRQEENVEHRNYRRSEFRYGSFSRTLPLPANAKDGDIKATYHDGVLEVRAPVDKKAKATSKISIGH
jgi:HSP20 family protein